MKNRKGIPLPLSAGTVALAVFLLVGCNKEGTPGGPGVTNPSQKPPLVGESNETFTLTTTSVSLRPGENAQETIGIKRGHNFDQDVSLAFEGVPNGVTISPAKPVIARGTQEVKCTLTANDGVPPADFTVKVIGHPATGSDATNQFKLTVDKKDSFTLSVPFWTTSIKQGEAKSFSIGINRDRHFTQDVTLSFNSLPMGVTVEPATGVIKNGESEAKFTLKAAENAALGDFTVKVNGQPATGVTVIHDFKFSISKK
jgi:hypothetical protein